jgi:hypothetical protein
MKALAGPAMLLVMVGGFVAYKSLSKDDAPSRDFVELELAAEDADHTGTCYSLSTVLVANGVFGNALRTWTRDEKNERKWTLTVENVRQQSNGPVHEFQKFTFEKFAEQVRLVDVDASEGYPTDIEKNIDRLLQAPHARKSTPVDRCLEDGGTGYQFPPRK